MKRFPSLNTTAFYCMCLLSFLLSVSAERVQSAVVLQYHHVNDETPAATSVSPALFERHMEYLEDNGFSVWPLTRIADYIARQKPFPDKVVAITFDDAYRSILTQALPRLKQRNFPFTVFVSTAQISDKEGSLMTWSDLQTLIENGGTLANHTHTHTHMVRRLESESRRQWLQRIHKEIEDAAKLLARFPNGDNSLFAYPYGEYTGEIKQLLGDLGYTAFGQHSGALGGLSDPVALPRFPMTNQFGELEQFKTKVHALALPVISISPSLHLIERSEILAEGMQLKIQEQGFLADQLACFVSGQGRAKLELSRGDTLTVRVQGPIRLSPGRSRINCTAPSTERGFEARYYWYSHPWMFKDPAQGWYPEY